MTLLNFFCCWLPNDNHIDELFESCLFRKDQEEILQVMADSHHQTPASMVKIRRPSDGCTLLLVASIAGDGTLVELLLQQQDEQQLVIVDKEGNSPLLCACLGGHFAVVVLLLKSSAKGRIITRANHEGTTPLMAAAWRGHLALVKLLLTQQPAGVMLSLTQQDAMGRTARDLANEWGHEHVVKWIDDQQKMKAQQ